MSYDTGDTKRAISIGLSGAATSDIFGSIDTVGGDPASASISRNVASTAESVVLSSVAIHASDISGGEGQTLVTNQLWGNYSTASYQDGSATQTAVSFSWTGDQSWGFIGFSVNPAS